ncbi:hypothetical protein J31TS4_05980 [Paenibacillus sp. J31TS4]|uniref:LysM peptidoglycan-binding domain-containing protein n=1 Tax=Paenibacillus sp. J31TS4 TaxID=2807195 RepID=UPI001B1B3454|nr:LysM peptidoglycan-binding domain-containing protein [Paenibacillus sp. J31TS4]GIP37318.1 hypothetical protein J31TS4_05980 [Paenibacillus sp. J31TS4]
MYIGVRVEDNKRQKRAVARLLFLILVASLLVSCSSLIKAYAGSGEEGAVSAASVRTVDVLPGDTLWSIAGEYAPDKTNLQPYISKMKKLNGLKSSSIQIGQTLLLP